MRRWLTVLLALVVVGIAPRANAQHADELDRAAPEADRDRDRLGPLVPDFARLSSGGWLGAANLALGYAIFDDALNVSVGYGFTPARAAGHAVHNFDLTLAVRPFELQLEDLRLVPAYAGAGILYVPGSEYEIRYPYRYRRLASRYYYPTALHWFAFLGTELGLHVEDPFFDRHALFFQIVGIDTFVTAYFDNDQSLGVTDVLSSAVGYRASW